MIQIKAFKSHPKTRMDAPQISIILNSWATALKEGNNNKRSRASLNDLVEKYSLDDHTEKSEMLCISIHLQCNLVSVIIC